MPGPRQNHPPRRCTFQQAEALCSGGLHRFARIGQRLAQRLNHGLVLPGFEQARGLGADLFGRVLRESIHQPQQAVRFFKVSQFDQGNPAHAGVLIGQTWFQGDNVGVVGYSKK
ncbi:hypothetical protein D3C81_1880390 [compost metagenome]